MRVTRALLAFENITPHRFRKQQPSQTTTMIPSDLIQALTSATVLSDNARGHSRPSTPAAESIPPLCSFSKSMRKKSGRRLLGSPTSTPLSPSPIPSTDRRWESSSSPSPKQSPLYYKSPNSPSSSAFQTSPFSPSSNSSSGEASPRIPRRKLSGEVIQNTDQSPRKPTRRTVSPPIFSQQQENTPTSSPTSPGSPIYASVHICPLEPGYRRDTPHVAGGKKKKSVEFRKALTVAIDFCDLSD